MFRQYFIDPLLENWHYNILPGLQEFVASPLFWKIVILLASALFLFKALGRKRSI